MFGVLKVDQVSPLEPEDPDPVELTVGAGVIVFFDTGIDASSAPDAPGKLKAISPEGIGKGFLRADLEFLPVLWKVPLLQLGNHPFLLLGVSSPENVSAGSLRPPLLSRRREGESKAGQERSSERFRMNSLRV